VLVQDTGFVCHVRIFSVGKFINRLEGVRCSSNAGWNTIIPYAFFLTGDEDGSSCAM